MHIQALLFSLYFRILDDMEMYEKQTPFKLSDFIAMSNFLNLFLYKAVIGNLFGMYIYDFTYFPILIYIDSFSRYKNCFEQFQLTVQQTLQPFDASV